MKLNKLILKNFLNHREVTLDLSHINIFSGENGTGKSAIREAILFALTGITRRNPVNFGAKSCEVELQDGDWRILRKETSSGGKTFVVANGQGAIGGTNTEIQEKFEKEIGLTSAQVDAMLNTGRFLDMPEPERRQVIFKALEIEVNRENLIAWLARQNKETDWEKIVAELKKEKDFDFNDEANQKVFIERRRSSKRIVGELEERKRRFADLPVPDVKKRTEAENLLGELEGKVKELYEQRGQQRAVTQLQVELEAVKAELNKPDNSDKIKRLSDDLADLEKESEKKKQTLDSLLENVMGLEAKLNALNEFKALGDTCDRCGQKVTKTLAKKLAADHKKKQANIEAGLKQARDKYEQGKATCNNLLTQISNLKEEIRELEKTHYHGDRKALEKRYDEILTLIKESGTPANLEIDIRNLEARINKGRELVTSLKTAEDADKERAELEEEIALAESQIKQFDFLEKAYSPKGVKAELLREKLDGFQQTVNEMLAVINLGKLEVITERNGKEVFEISVNGLPEEAYSRAQRWAIAIALQGALSSNGLKILMIDDADMFVGQMKSLANKMIIANKSKFDSILIFRAADQRPQANGGEVKQFWLHGRGVEAV